MSQAPKPDFRAIAGNPSGVLRVLVLEHSAEDAALIVLELQRGEFQCHAKVVGTREEFVAELSRFPYDMVLADYRLSSWTGMDAFKAMRDREIDVPFILVTGSLGEEMAIECIRQGVTDYVLKEHLSRLRVAVTRALEDKRLQHARAFIIGALRQSEANSLFLFAHNPLPMWVVQKSNLHILQVNDAAIRLYGYDRLAFLQMTAADLHPPEEIPRLLKVFQSDVPALRASTQWHHEFRDRSSIDVEIFLHSMEYSGTPALLAVAIDITERNRVEKERQKFFTLVENSRDFIAVTDLVGNLEYVNPAGRLLLGLSSAEAVNGVSAESLIAPHDKTLFRDTVLHLIASIGEWKGELRFRHRETGDEVPVDFVGFQVKDAQTDDPQFIAAISRDMTERRLLEEQVQQAQKFEAIGKLAGGIAHDFNNVVAAILGWAELGEDFASQNEQISTYFKKIHAQCDRGTDLIGQLMAFARRQVLEPRMLDVNQTVRNVVTLVNETIGRNIELKTRLREDLQGIRADPAQIEQALMNLCIISRDAIPEGGYLLIETRNISFSEQDHLKDAALRAGHFVELRVSDKVSGVAAPRQMPEMNESTKRNGLALATVHRIVRELNGFVLLENEGETGSTYRIFLPAGNDTAKIENNAPVIEHQPSAKGTETILIAEDHEGIGEMARLALETVGYHILVASDGEQATGIFATHQDVIDLVLLDVMLPRQSGLEVYAAIEALRPGTPVIFATGYGSETAGLADVVSRGFAILQKPYSPAMLRRRVREVLDGAVPAQARTGAMHHVDSRR